MKTITLLLTITTHLFILTSSGMVSAGDRPPLSAECRTCLLEGDAPKPPSECPACATDSSSPSTNPSSSSPSTNPSNGSSTGSPSAGGSSSGSSSAGTSNTGTSNTGTSSTGGSSTGSSSTGTSNTGTSSTGGSSTGSSSAGGSSSGNPNSSGNTTSTSSGPRTPSSGLSDTETNFNGAIMLTGGEHVTFNAVGAIDESEDEALQQYAFFAGNTLFTGTSSEAGSVELLSEFFWFETSRDRGSDFYVGVVKGRTSPKKVGGWRLEYSSEVAPFSWLPQDGSALMVRLSTDPNQGNAFRWDWSIPFDDYHWDSYGNVSMNASYGLNANAEGSVQTGTKIDANGVKAAGTVQSKGFFAIDSQVTTRYEVTLWRWNLFVNSNASDLEWNIVLNNGDRDNQNAYHEFFAVMQTGQDIPFEIEEIIVEGHVRKPTLVLSFLGVESKKTMRGTAAGITLRSPYSPVQLVDEPDENGETTPESEPFEEDPFPENPFPEESIEEPEPPPHDGSEEIPNDGSDAAPAPFGTEDVNDDESDDDVESDDAGGCSAHHTQSSMMSALIMALFSLLVYQRLRSRWFSP